VRENACKQYIFWSYETNLILKVRFGENPFTSYCEKENKKAKGF